MEPSISLPKHWRDRATHARIVAQLVGEPEVKQLLYEVAHRYERIAVIVNAKPLPLRQNRARFLRRELGAA